MSKFKVGDVVVLNRNISHDAAQFAAPGDSGLIRACGTKDGTNYLLLENPNWEIDLAVPIYAVDFPLSDCIEDNPFLADHNDPYGVNDVVLLDPVVRETVPDCWEPDLLMTLGYRGLV